MSLVNLFWVIAMLESGNDPDAFNGRDAGIIQLSPIYVEECNRLGGNFTLEDRYNPTKSIQMFELYNKGRTSIEEIVRIHRSGKKNMNNAAADAYWNRAYNIIKERIR